MRTIGLVLAILAGLLHVYIWWIEAVTFERSGHKVFGVPAADVPVARPWAYNQGYYNLFLGIGAVAGAVAALAGTGWGVPWAVLATGCMVGAALVLVLSDRTKVRSALVQGTIPALGLIALAIAQA
jgi:putative membrane protein